MAKSIKIRHRELNQYPLLHHTLASIIYQSILGLCSNTPVLLEIDRNLILEFQRYGKMPFEWWEKHLTSYSINYVSLAQTSAWIKLEHPLGKDIFQEGTYFYNCSSGCFEIEMDSNGMLVDIFGEFNGNTPSIIPDLFKDYPDQEYLSDNIFSDQSSVDMVLEDEDFIRGLIPAPFKIIEVE